MGSTELMQVPNFMQTDTDFSFSFPAFIRLSKGHERLRSTCGLNCRGNWSGDPRVCCFNGQSCGFRAPPAHNQRVPASCPGTFLTIDVNQVTSHHFSTSEYEDTPPVRTSKGYAMDREATMVDNQGRASRGTLGRGHTHLDGLVPHPGVGTGAVRQAETTCSAPRRYSAADFTCPLPSPSTKPCES